MYKRRLVLVAVAAVLCLSASAALAQCGCGGVVTSYTPSYSTYYAPTVDYYAPAAQVTYYAPAPSYATYYAPAYTTYYPPAVPYSAYYAPAVTPYTTYYGVPGYSVYRTPTVYVPGRPVVNTVRSLTW